ncbi:MAG: FAD:protein FMN transferase [Anaerolineales bacterium]|nr:FAD:protein FMN transferase [Anaerolineales bacterium]
MKPQAHPATWQSHSFWAMGSQVVLWLDSSDVLQAAAAFAQAEALFVRNERALSRFRPDSELMQLNARSGQWVTVSDLLWREVALAVEMARQTDGRFDPTLLKALVQAGYDCSFEQVRSGDHFSWWESEKLYGRWADVALDETRQAVRLPAGVALDLGGIAKGDTAQQARNLLQLVGPCLVDAGGDLVAGAAPLGQLGWPVALSQPGADDFGQDDLATFWLANGALATSGIDYRRWLQNGRLAHHLIDPRTGQSASTDLLTATVLAHDAAAAEAWATATLIAGADVGMALLLDRGLAGLVVVGDGRILATPQMDQLLQGEFLLLA